MSNCRIAIVGGGLAGLAAANALKIFGIDAAVFEAAPELRDRIEVECFNRGLIVLGCGYNTIRWSPPLTLTRENVDVALEIFDEAITAACR